MKLNLNGLFYWFLNLFSFKRPVFITLKYVDCVFDDKTYLLIEWQMKNAYKLKIKELGYLSFRKNASAYMFIPGDVSKIKVRIANVWRSESEYLELKRTAITVQTDFNLQPEFKTFNVSVAPFNNLNLIRREIHLKGIKIQLSNHGTLRTQNLNYIQEHE